MPGNMYRKGRGKDAPPESPMTVELRIGPDTAFIRKSKRPASRTLFFADGEPVAVGLSAYFQHEFGVLTKGGKAYS